MAGHDQLFKDLLERFFPDLLHIVMPHIAERLDLDDPKKIQFLRHEHFTDLPVGEHRQVDLLAQISARKDGQLVLVHVEIERQKRSTMAERLGRYSMGLYLRHKELVASVVLYLKGGRAGIHKRIFRLELYDEELMSFAHWELALSPNSAEDFLAMEYPLAWGLAALMRGGGLTPAQHKLQCLTRILRTEKPLDDASKLLLLNCVETYVELDESDEEEFTTMITQKKGYRDVLEIYDSGKTWEDRIREEAQKQGWEEGKREGRHKGMQEGRREGRQEGRIEGQRKLILRQLELRFGSLPPAVRRQVEALDASKDLQQLGERVLTAESLADLGLSS